MFISNSIFISLSAYEIWKSYMEIIWVLHFTRLVYKLLNVFIWFALFSFLLLKWAFYRWSSNNAEVKGSWISMYNLELALHVHCSSTSVDLTSHVLCSTVVFSGTSGKEPTCQCTRCKRYRFDPWVGTIPGEGHGNPLQVAWRVPWTEKPGRLQSILL